MSSLLLFVPSPNISCLPIIRSKHVSRWDFKFLWQRVWCSELSSGTYCRVKWLSTDVSEVRTASETSVDSHFTRQYIPEDNSEQHVSQWTVEQSAKWQKLCETTSGHTAANTVPRSSPRRSCEWLETNKRTRGTTNRKQLYCVSVPVFYTK
jgi:hypothetical protein